MIDPPPSRQSPHSFSAFDIRRLDIPAYIRIQPPTHSPVLLYTKELEELLPTKQYGPLVDNNHSSYSDDKRSTCAYCCIACLIRVCLNSRPLYILHSLRVSCKAAYMLYVDELMCYWSERELEKIFSPLHMYSLKYNTKKEMRMQAK